MTLNELYSEVLTLCGESEGTINEAFIFSVNRAASIIFSELVGFERFKIETNAQGAVTTDLRDTVSLRGPIEAEDGSTIKGALIDCSGISLPIGFCGTAYAYRKRLPKKLTLDDMGKEIDIPRFAEYLLALMTAAFLLLDEDPERASFYISLYKSEADRHRRFERRSYDNRVEDVTGWA